MPIIKSAQAFGDDFIELSKLARETRQPIFLTRDGEGDVVLLSMEQYDEKFARDELHEKLEKGEEDLLAGRVKSKEEVYASMRETIAQYIRG